jgi:MarR family
MPLLRKLLQSLKAKYRNLVELERELADLDRQIIAGGHRPAKKKGTPRAVPASHSERYDYLRPMLRAMRDAGQPLPPREIAARLNVEPKIASRRLARALKLGYVERAGNARYRVTDSVRSVPEL